MNEFAYELRAKLEAAEARIVELNRELDQIEEVERLTELAEKWAIDARNASERADAAEARLEELEAHLASERITRNAMLQKGVELEARLRAVIKAGDAMAKSAGYISPPLEWTAACQQGGAK